MADPGLNQKELTTVIEATREVALPEPPIGPLSVQSLKQRLGLDRSIAFTVLARVLQGAGSIGTVLLIVRLLTPAEQGYYYSLWSLVALQVVFELGFSFVILQTAAHELARVQRLADGSVVGDPIARARLASILRLSVRWYTSGAVLMGVAMLMGATYFFEHQAPGTEVVWQWPLRCTIAACCLTFAIGPVVSFLEGSGMVTEVSRMRLMQAAAGTGLAWCAMSFHGGLFAPALVLLGQGLSALWLLARHRRYLIPLLQHAPGEHSIVWRREIWPFQWKIAVSWMCDYFIFQLFTPVLFAARGPVEAGRMGLSMSAVTQFAGIVLSWMSTKAAPFGDLVARGERTKLDDLFFRTLRQSLLIFLAGSSLILVAVFALPHVLPKLASRVAPWPVFLLLLLTAGSSHVVQSEGLYLRAHKTEPFLIQSLVIAACTAALVMLLARPFGAIGVTAGYFVMLGVAGFISATLIFRRERRRYQKQESL